MDEDIVLNEISQAQKGKYYKIPLTEASKVVKFTEIGRMVVNVFNTSQLYT